MRDTRPGPTPQPGRPAPVLPVALLALTLTTASPGQEPSPASVPATAAGSWDLRGRFDASWRWREQTRENENDSDALLSAWLDGSHLDADGRETFRFVFDGLLTADLDGLGRSTEAFYGLQDSRDSRTHGYVYEAWAETSELADDVALRVGRQEIHREDALYFDGARLDLGGRGPVDLLAYAGSPVRFYQSDRSGDFLGGAGLRWAASRELRLGVDEIFFRDRAPAGDPAATVNNNLTLFTGHWYRDESSVIHGSSSWLGSRDRRQEITWLWNHPVEGWWSRLQFRHQNDYGEVIATDLSPFAAVLGDVAPYWSGIAEIHRQLGASADLGLGFQGRWLEDAGDEGVFDREYHRWYAMLSLAEFPVPELRTGVRGDLWDSEDARILAGGVFLAWDPDDASRFEIGTDFAKYRYDAYARREYLDDRQYYFRARHRFTEAASLSLRLARDYSQFGADDLIEVALALEF